MQQHQRVTARTYGCRSLRIKNIEHEAEGRGTTEANHQTNNGMFINGLKTECHALVNTENAETEEEFDAIVEKAKIAERREQEKKRTRRRKEKNPG